MLDVDDSPPVTVFRYKIGYRARLAYTEGIVHEDIELNRRKYRILVEPLGVRSPEAPKAAVYLWEGEHLGPEPIKDRLGEPGETEGDLLKWARQQVELHSKTWSPSLKYRCPSSGLLFSADVFKVPSTLTPDEAWTQKIESNCAVCGQKHQMFLG